MSTEEKRTPLFEEVCSEDFLKFKFGARGYIDQLNDAITKTGHLAGVKVDLVEILAEGPAPIQIVWVSHNFAFLGGSLGCAEGEKITRAFEYGMEKKLPVVVECRSGGARMQEGTSSLMQMAKVAVAVQAFQAKGLPFVAILCDPTYGGVSASYAMQADCRIAVADARIGFAGPQVILNTMCEGNQKLYDAQCPSDFQAAKFLYENGQVDCVVESAKVTDTVARLLRSLLLRKPEPSPANEGHANPPEKPDMSLFNYTRARKIDRPQTQDLIRELFTDFVEMAGDGKVGLDVCVKGGIAAFRGHPCVVLATSKGHTPGDMQKANYGMPSPHGYRTAYRLMQTAERFSIPVVTLIDTVGAYPNFQSEKEGQSEAIASNLTLMAGLKVPIISLLVGEGGSGGALGLCMGNVIGMLSGGYFGVISPEGAASILGRYDDEEHKAKQFPLDCQELARAQCIYATQLKDLGVVDQVVWEPVHDLGAVESSAEETFQNFPKLKSRIEKFLSDSIGVLSSKSVDQLLTERYAKYRSIGTFKLCTSEEERQKAVEAAKAASQAAVARGAGKRASTAGDKKGGETSAPVIKQLAEETVVGTRSRYLHLAPDHIHEAATALESYFQTHKFDPPPTATGEPTTAKGILDKYGPEHLAQWVMKEAKNRVFLTDTSMRDAHQSLLATRVRTVDIVNAARVASNVLKDGFSLECWGGATFDVAMRFLDECPWERLREVRKACPNICTQMLIRGANAVGYTSYPDDVVEEFVRLAAKNGMDVFRIFDCFNSVDSMRVCIDAVRATGKVAEVCICYTGNLLSSKIYHVDYYRELAKEIKAAGAHFIAIKDMAGLLRPLEVEPLMKAVREGSGGSLPIHFHMHATSSGALATLMEMTRCECEIVDVCAASIADGTSQPSMDAFVAMTEGGPRQTKMKFMDLAPYEELWARIRSVYSVFESGMLSGTARVYDHQIPGGQYSNLLVQCNSLGMYGDKWETVLDTYRDVNMLFGDIIKVTPSSKCVGDLALFLVNRGLTCEDLKDPVKGAAVDFPESVVGLFKGDLGFPHRGFPSEIEKIVLRGQKKRTGRAGVQLPPVDMKGNIKSLSEKFGIEVSEEEAMSSLMYPKVFADYIKKQMSGRRMLTHVPSAEYFYGMAPGEHFSFSAPVSLLKEVFVDPSKASEGMGPEESVEVTVSLVRVGPLQKSHRTVEIKLTSKTKAGATVTEKQSVSVKDTAGVFHYDGPMANPAKKTDQEYEIASPMPGQVIELLAHTDDAVKAGDILAVISAMKMEVKVSAPRDGTIKSISVAHVGAKVVEGALLVTLGPAP